MRQMLTRRRVLSLPLIMSIGAKVGLHQRSSVASDGTPVAAGADQAVLDGAAPVDAGALAELARNRVELAAGWLAGAQRPTGVFYYVYDPVTDTYETTTYNEVRHAGTTYALFQAYGLLGHESILTVAEHACDWIRRSTVPVRAAGRGFLDIQNGDISLGGQALALVALLERRRVTGDTSVDPLIGDLAKFVLWMERDDHTGRFYNFYIPKTGMRSEMPEVEYYPGEALLALTRLAEQFPDGPYLDVAKRAADFLVHRRDGDIPRAGTVPREDHWLTIALSELYRLDNNEDFATVAYLQADSMIAHQYTAADGDPERIGGARSETGTIGFTSTATKGEAIVAAWGLAAFRDDPEGKIRMSLGAQRNAQFQMRVQFTASNTAGFVEPGRTIGGWGANADDPSIRIDYVQHNMSALIGLAHLSRDGDLPIAMPPAASSDPAPRPSESAAGTPGALRKEPGAGTGCPTNPTALDAPGRQLPPMGSRWPERFLATISDRRRRRTPDWP
ncbi:MAG TPA: hypothetical protein VH482_06530 [Thermomicrobiales bacterium]